MPDAEGRIRPISVPAVPWHEDEPIKYVAGTIPITEQMHDEALRVDRIFDDIAAGRVEWNADDVDWDAWEEMHES